MPTQRKRTQATARQGVNFVRSIVEACNCIFQEVDAANDIGNDAYIEFITDESATGCCIAAQIKSGDSFRTASNDYIIPADRDHFEYWASHTLPVAGIVYDPTHQRATWIDITAWLKANPSRIREGPFQIRLDPGFRLDEEGFARFQRHFLAYRPLYSSDPAFGTALAAFSDLEHPDRALEGLRALFSFHRQRWETWFYLINSFGAFKGHSLLRSMVYVLMHLPGHGDIGWGDRNIIREDVRQTARAFLKRRFARSDVEALLESVDDNGFERGTIGQAAHAIIHDVADRDSILKAIAFDPVVADEIRVSALFLWASYRQSNHRREVLRAIPRYIKVFPETQSRSVLEELAQIIRQFGYFGMY